MTKVDAVLAKVDENLPASVERVLSLVRFETVSTDQMKVDQFPVAAAWLQNLLSDLGFRSEVVCMPDVLPGHPIVVGSEPASTRRRPSATFYAHYDVQPVDPLGLWDHDPFQPAVMTRSDGSQFIRGRGACDDKGQLMTFLEAVRAWRDVEGEPPIQLKVLIEGEEEIGGKSPSLEEFLKAHGERIRSDIVLVCDTTMWAPGIPAITLSLRGIATGRVTVKCANRDLHSGLFGGVAPNANAILAAILADLHDRDGRVTLGDFYDGVRPVPKALERSWKKLNVTADSFLAEFGVRAVAEPRLSVLQQVWARPTAEVNGMWGGFIGDGFKSVVPAEAHANLSFRLVGDQDPDRVWSSFEDHVRERLPVGCAAQFQKGEGARAITIPPDSKWVRSASEALRHEWGVEPVLAGGGGSLPVAEQFKRLTGMDSLLVGFALDGDNAHAPNEKYELSSFRGGIRSWVRILDNLSRDM